MTGLFNILDKIKTRPGMYIGGPSLSDLFMFLAGYKIARRELGMTPTSLEMDFFANFHAWVENRFEVRTANSWAKIILLFSRNEEDGFVKFFMLLDEFQQREGAVTESGTTGERKNKYVGANGVRP